MSETIPFVGLNRRTGQEIDVPNHFIDKHGDRLRGEGHTFSSLYHDLPRAFSTEVAYRNPETGEWEETDRFNAVYDPDKLGLWDSWDEETREQRSEYDPLYTVPTDSYSIVNPVEFYEPLEDALLNEEITDVYGWAHIDKRGGEGFLNVMFANETDIPDEATDSLHTGLRTGYSHIGTVSCFAEGFAQDWQCSNSMYSLTDRKSRRHVGNAKDDVEWWEDVLTAYGALPDHLADMIREALEFTVNINDDVPFDQWVDLYELAGFPEYMARAAGSNAQSRSDDPFEVNAWELHSGATYALTHVFSGNEESDTKDEYIRTANDILQNPAMFVENLRTEYERRLQAQEGDEEVYSVEGLEQMEDTTESIEDLKEQYEERQEEMNELLAGVGVEEGE